jgi:CheY-like chemotaxis protein
VTSAVLVTDDEPDIRLMLRTVLQARGWTVEEASSGDEAIARIERGGLDVVILDHKMPGLTGAETARKLRAHGVTTPIVLYSAYLTPEIEADAEAEGLEAVAKDDLPGLVALLDRLRPTLR